MQRPDQRRTPIVRRDRTAELSGNQRFDADLPVWFSVVIVVRQICAISSFADVNGLGETNGGTCHGKDQTQCDDLDTQLFNKFHEKFVVLSASLCLQDASNGCQLSDIDSKTSG